jgi:hypothetical protein
MAAVSARPERRNGDDARGCLSGLDSSPARQVAAVIVAVLAAIALLLTAAVALYDRPMLLVPPHLRNLPAPVTSGRPPR